MHTVESDVSGKPVPGAPPLAIRIARLLFCVNGLIWLTFGVLMLARPAGSTLADLLDDTYRWILFWFMVLNAALMVTAGVLLRYRRLVVWLFALGLLAVNIALTFTDDVGLADWATAALDVVIVGLLIGARAWFSPVRQG